MTTEPGVSATNDELKAKLTDMTTVQLKGELTKRWLKTTGLKNELVLRLLPFMQLESEHGEAGRCDDGGKDDDESEDDDEDSSSSEEEDELVPVRRR